MHRERGGTARPRSGHALVCLVDIDVCRERDSVTSDFWNAELRRVAERLRQSGQRVTRQRLAVFSALARLGGHRTAEEVYDYVRAHHPDVNLSTVYRNLDLGVELGLVTQTDLGGGVRRFELVRAERHHHLVCQRCRTVMEFEDELLEPLRAALRERYRFIARMDHFAIFGTCARCRSNGTDSLSRTGEASAGRM